MSRYVISARRLHPGQIGAYVESVRAIAAHLARTTQQRSFELCFAVDDPHDVLLIGGWARREDFATAIDTLPDRLREATVRPVAEWTADWRWYRSLRSLITYTLRSKFLVAIVSRIQPSEASTFVAWARQVQDAALSIPGVVNARLLVAEESANEFVELYEYADSASRQAANAMRTAFDPPAGLVTVRAFSGQIGFSWDRWEPVPIAETVDSAPSAPPVEPDGQGESIGGPSSLGSSTGVDT